MTWNIPPSKKSLQSDHILYYAEAFANVFGVAEKTDMWYIMQRNRMNLGDGKTGVYPSAVMI